MFKRYINPTVKAFVKPQLFGSYKPNFAFSTFSPNIKTDFFISENQRKRFYFEKDATLQNVETILRREDKSYQSIIFRHDGNEVQDKSMLFVDAFLKQNLKLEINRQVIPLHIDLNGPAAYSNDTPYDDHLAENEVPIYDSLLITNFTKVFHQNLEKKFPSRQSYDVKEIQDALTTTVQSLTAKLKDTSNQNQKLLEELAGEHIKDRIAYDELIRQAHGKSNSILKYAIAATIVQWAILFYLTYYEVGWDVVEPISYLIALAIEGLGIYFYVRYAKSFRQKSIFDMLFKEKRLSTLKTKSVNPEVELNYLRNKMNYFTQRASHSNPL